jgi:hypothetical protein
VNDAFPTGIGQLDVADFLFGLYPARSIEHKFRFRRLAVGGDQTADVTGLCLGSLKREDLALEEVTDRPEGAWFAELIEGNKLATDKVPAGSLTSADTKGRPRAVIVPARAGKQRIVFAFKVTDSMVTRFGSAWLSLFASEELVKSTHLAGLDEREWQVSQGLVAVLLAGDKPRVFVEKPAPDAPSELAQMFEDLDPAGRRNSSQAIAAKAIEAISSIDGGLIELSSESMKALATHAEANLRFSTQLENAIKEKRWVGLSSDRLFDELGESAGARWRVRSDKVVKRDGHIELDVSEKTILRILRDAFARSVLNSIDLIEGEGRPAENPDLLEP